MLAMGKVGLKVPTKHIPKADIAATNPEMRDISFTTIRQREKFTYKGIPKDKVGNLQWRRKVMESTHRDKRLQQAFREKCKSDALYWFNGFCWLIEPRPGEGELGHGKIPFITRPIQDRVVKEMVEHWGKRDVGVEKARAEGVTWLVLLLILHDFLFGDASDFPLYGLVSRNEDAVDNSDDPDALLPKLDWELKQQPTWLLPPNPRQTLYRSVSKHTLTNKANGANITGYAATEDVGRGGRKKVWFMDELASFPMGKDYAALASTQHTTKCRVFVSTPAGSTNAYYDQMHDPSSNMVKIVMDWRDNPFRNRGLYVVRRGRPKAVNTDVFGVMPKEYQKDFAKIRVKLERKGYKVEGTTRSPWFDQECLRPGATPQKIAQELERDYQGSEYQVYGHEFHDVGSESILAPKAEGVFDYHPETLEPDFDSVAGGPLKLWCHLHGDRPPTFNCSYVVACDIASGLAGSFSSNSVAAVIDRVTREQVAVYVTNTVDPDDFADLSIALCKWFNNALLIWECNGDNGSRFTQQVLQRRYHNLYMREVKFKRFKKQTREPGWFSDRQTKAAALGALSKAIKQRYLKVREALFFQEAKEYIYDQTGKIVHSKSRARATEDNSAVGEAHGDRVIAMAVGWWAIKDYVPELEQAKPLTDADYEEVTFEQCPRGSMAWRLKKAEVDRRRIEEFDSPW